MNLASRTTLATATGWASHIGVTLASVLPIVAVVWRRAWSLPQIAGISILAVPALAAWHGFPHYWIVPLAGCVAFPSSRLREPVVSRLAAGLVLVPVAVLALGSLSASGRVVARYDEVAHHLQALPTDRWSYVPLDLQPLLAAHFPEHVAIRAPSLNYLLWSTSRTDAQRAELDLILAEADIIIDPGLYRGLTPIPQLETVLPQFRRHLGEDFPCMSEIAGVAVFKRPHLCHL